MADDRHTAHLQWIATNIAIVRVFAEGKQYGDDYLFWTVLKQNQRHATLMGAYRPVTRHIARAINDALVERGFETASWVRVDGTVRRFKLRG